MPCPGRLAGRKWSCGLRLVRYGPGEARADGLPWLVSESWLSAPP